MALVFADGFDHYQTADVLKKWTGLCASAAAPTDIGPEYARPPGGMGLFNYQAASRGVYKTFAATHVSFVCGFNVNFQSASATGAILGFFDSSSGTPGATYQISLKLDGSAHLQVFTGASTVLATSANTMSASTWYHVEIKATINNSTGTYEVRVNGSATGWIAAATGKNTRGQSANNYIDVVALEPAGSTAVTGQYVDDFYFLSSSAPNNDFLGPQKILAAFPAATGNYAQWTGNYATNFANVNETTADGDQTFNQSATANQIDSFVFDDVPAGTISAVQFCIEARQDAGAARTIAAFERAAAGPTDRVMTSQILAGSYLIYTDPRDVDPDTSAAWTATLFNSNEYGYKEIS